MTGKEIRALRGTLGLSVGALGSKLGVEAATVLGWEREELFPTKRALESLMALQGEAWRHDESIRRSKDPKELRANVQQYLQKLEETVTSGACRKASSESARSKKPLASRASSKAKKRLTSRASRRTFTSGRAGSDGRSPTTSARSSGRGSTRSDPSASATSFLDLSAEALAAWLADPAAQ